MTTPPSPKQVPAVDWSPGSLLNYAKIGQGQVNKVVTGKAPASTLTDNLKTGTSTVATDIGNRLGIPWVEIGIAAAAGIAIILGVVILILSSRRVKDTAATVAKVA